VTLGVAEGTVFSINAATPTLSVSDAGGTYNGQSFAATATVGGVVYGVDETPAATLEGVGLKLDYVRLNDDGTTTDLGSTAPSGAGSYQVTASFAGSADYLASSATTSFTIQKADANFGISRYTVTYDGTAHTATATVTGVLGEDLSSELDLSGTAHTNAGIYTDTWTFTDTTGNYNKASGTVSDAIAQATPALTVADLGGVYNGTPFPATDSALGVDRLTSVAGTWSNTYYRGTSASGTPLSGAPVNAGTYTVLGNFTSSDGNYTGGSATTTFQITPAPVTVSVSDAGGTYNAKPFPATAKQVGSNYGGTFVITYYSGTSAGGTALPGAPTDAGTYTAQAVFTSTDGNHAGSGTQTFTISQAKPKVTVSAKNLTYNASPDPATGSVTGVGSISLGTPTLTYYVGSGTTGTNLGSTAPTNAGTYTVVASYAGSTDYAAATAQATFTISQAKPTFSGLTSSQSVKYGTSSVLLSGHLGVNASLWPPQGETITITIGSVVETAALDSNGNFVISAFPIGKLAKGKYTITYSYSGDTDFAAATNTSMTLTIS
jgi:hypothetical protein